MLQPHKKYRDPLFLENHLRDVSPLQLEMAQGDMAVYVSKFHCWQFKITSIAQRLQIWREEQDITPTLKVPQSPPHTFSYLYFLIEKFTLQQDAQQRPWDNFVNVL